MVWDNSKENILEKFLVMLKGSNPVLSRTFLLNTAEFSYLLSAGLVDTPKCMYYMDFHGRTELFLFVLNWPHCFHIASCVCWRLDHREDVKERKLSIYFHTSPPPRYVFQDLLWGQHAAQKHKPNLLCLRTYLGRLELIAFWFSHWQAPWFQTSNLIPLLMHALLFI